MVLSMGISACVQLLSAAVHGHTFVRTTMMIHAATAWVGLVIIATPARCKILLDSLNQLETNLISETDQAPQQARLLENRDWVRISESPPQVINTRLGERVELECEAYGSPYPDIEWLRGDRSITALRKVRRTSGMTKVTSRLVLECVTRKHEGFYTCSASAGIKNTRGNPTLILVDGIGHGDMELCSPSHRQPPRILSWAQTAMEAMGGTVQLPCLVTGNPKPSLYWIDPNNNLINSVRHTVAASGELTISQLSWSDMGEYTCVVESPEGKDQISTFVYPYLNAK